MSRSRWAAAKVFIKSVDPQYAISLAPSLGLTDYDTSSYGSHYTPDRGGTNFQKHPPLNSWNVLELLGSPRAASACSLFTLRLQSLTCIDQLDNHLTKQVVLIALQSIV